MKQTIEIPEGHELKQTAEGKYEIVPVETVETKPKFWMPEHKKAYHFIWEDGGLGTVYPTGIDTAIRAKHHNIFKTREDAKDVSKYQRVFNAVCRAVKQIEPDFVPDWNDIHQSKFILHLNGSGWYAPERWGDGAIFPPVSTREKCHQVIDLLNAEGIVPVGKEQDDE